MDAPRHVDLRFVSDAEMRVLNRDYRGKDKPTDVLSFALCELSDDAIDMMPAYALDEPVALGDILIAVETAHRQAQERGHDLSVEVTFLAVHGGLHLLGYDHQTSAQRRKMFALQDQIVADL